LTLPSFATYWADRLGAKKESLIQLSGGINNRVFSCSRGHQKWIIKAYPNQNRDQHNRMKAEIDFLRYAEIAAPDFTPIIFQIDQANCCIVMEYIEGDSYLSKVQLPSVGHLRHSADFIGRLNRDMLIAKKLVKLDAADGFSSLSKHVLSIRERFAMMRTHHIPIQFKAKANNRLGLLRERIDEVDAMLQDQIDSGTISDQIMACDKWVSPSDFGFHNAVFTSNKIKFIDFEFAGWDDPVKTVLDFWMQPRIQVPNDWIDIVIGLFEQCHRKHLFRRLSVAADIFELKWASIVLSVLNPVRYQQMLYTFPEISDADLLSSRLETSLRYLEKLRSSEFKSSFQNLA